jgi:type I restriction enzyme M protein
MISRNQKELSEKDIAKISGTYHNWRKASETVFSGLKDGQDLNNLNPANQEIRKSSSDYVDIPGFCKSVIIEDIRKNNYILTPGIFGLCDN